MSRDQILCPLIVSVACIDKFERRGSSVPFTEIQNRSDDESIPLFHY